MVKRRKRRTDLGQAEIDPPIQFAILKKSVGLAADRSPSLSGALYPPGILI